MKQPIRNGFLQNAFDGAGQVASGYGGLTVGYKTVREVWIGDRTSNKVGSGTAIDPYDGSTRAKFDALMVTHGSVANTIIRLHDAEYDTYGYGAYTLAAGVRVVGNGPYNTQLKMMYLPTDNLNIGILYGLDNCEFHDLGFNCNYTALVAALGAHTNANLYAFNGRSGIAHNVRAIDAGGDNETFVMGFHAYGAVAGSAAAREALAPRYSEISTFRVESPSASSTANLTAVSINAGYFESAGLPASDVVPYGGLAVIKDGRVDGGIFGTSAAAKIGIAYQMGGFRDGLIDGVYARNCSFGFFHDTFPQYDLKLLNSKFEGVSTGVNLNGGGASVNSHGRLAGLSIVTFHAGIAINDGHDMIVELNKIRKVPGATISAGGVIFQNKNADGAVDTGGNIFRHNRVGSDFTYAEVLAANGATGTPLPQLENNRYFDGTKIASVPDTAFPFNGSGNVSLLGNLTSAGELAATGAYTPSTTTAGFHAGVVGTKPRLLLANGTAAQNWELIDDAGVLQGVRNGVLMFEIDSAGRLALSPATGYLLTNGLPVVGTRKTGWGVATGTAARTTFVTSTVTLEELAKRVKALTDDLISHGLIGS